MKDIAMTLAWTAIRSADPYLAVRKALKFEDGKLKTGGETFEAEKLHVLAVERPPVG